jgi:epoxide hydrolase-like predicted phosphatase
MADRRRSGGRATESAIDAVVFDFGGTLTGVVGDLYLRFATEAGIPPEALVAPFVDGYPGLADMEVGKIGFNAYIGQVCERLSAEYGTFVDSARLRECIDESLWPTDEMIALVGEVRRHHRTAILTNNHAELREVWVPRMPEDLVDLIVDSCQVGLRKPDRAAYEFTVGNLGTTPERCVFVDDTAANVKAAADYGMHTVLFTDHAQCRRELIALGVQL